MDRTSTETVIGKRKTRSSLVLHISGASGTSESEYEPPVAGPSRARTPTAVIRKASSRPRPYQCAYNGCDKAYTKPSRLEEHERSHTGVRPYVCATCNKSFLRESHLQAHARSHLSPSDRPLACSEPDCDKRFWTAQHLRYHENVFHKGEKPFTCTAEHCTAAFLKHHQLRSHLATAHAPPGTQPYQCEHEGCTKSFTTTQKLVTHAKVHIGNRYTCVHASCISAPAFFSNWTALQHHMRTAHPPTCPHASCNGRVFVSHKGLRGHLKVHEQRDVDAAIDEDVEDDHSSDGEADARPRKRRRGGEVGRDWQCSEEGCSKDFKSKRALTTHHAITHLGKREFVCTEEGCGRAFGYKHILQRHVARVHGQASVTEDADADGGPATDREHDARRPAEASAIDAMTGKAYAERATAGQVKLPCPFPEFKGLPYALPPAEDEPVAWRLREPCEYTFGRAYDLRRHLRAIHDVVLEKDVVDTWAQNARG